MGMCLLNYAVGAPYIMVDWITGNALDRGSVEIPPKGDRERLFKGLATSLLELSYQSSCYTQVVDRERHFSF